MRKIVFQVIRYKPFQILVETFPEPWARGSPSIFHFRIRTRFQVPGFEWVHELLLFCSCSTSNSAQFCAEISCGELGLGHNQLCNCTDSRLQAWGVTPSTSGFSDFVTIVDSTWFVPGKKLARDTFPGLGTS